MAIYILFFYLLKCIIVQRVIVCILLEIYKFQEFQKMTKICTFNC